jgi:hypothetical protein
MFGAWPALRKNLIQLRGIFFVLLVVVAIVELHNRQLSLFWQRYIAVSSAPPHAS